MFQKITVCLVFTAISILFVSIVANAKTVAPKTTNEVQITMDGIEVHRIKNPTYLKDIDKNKYKATDNDLVMDLAINLKDRGIQKNVAGCVDELIQQSKRVGEERLNIYSVEALGLLCANYPRHVPSSDDKYKKYFDGLQTYSDGKEGLLVLEKPENKTESISALKGLPVEKIDLNIEKDELGNKFCTNSSRYASKACENLDCGKAASRYDTPVQLTSCANPICKGLTRKAMDEIMVEGILYYNEQEKLLDVHFKNVFSKSLRGL